MSTSGKTSYGTLTIFSTGLACFWRERRKLLALVLLAPLTLILLGQQHLTSRPSSPASGSAIGSLQDQDGCVERSVEYATQITSNNWLDPPAAVKRLHKSKWRRSRDKLIRLITEHGQFQKVYREGPEDTLRAIVYTCSYGGFCGGLADRLEGVVVLYMAAVVSKRAFFINWDKPTSLENFYVPHVKSGVGIDWRLSSFPGDSGILKKIGSMKRVQLLRHDDSLECNRLVSIIRDPAGPAVLSLTTNHAKSCVTRMVLKELKFKSMPPDAMGLAFHWLFKQSERLTNAVETFIRENKWSSQHGICMHVRHGGKMGLKKGAPSVDPERHGNITVFWQCAAKVLQETVGPGLAQMTRSGEEAAPGGCTPAVQQWLVVSDDDDIIDEAQRSLPKPAVLLDTRSIGPVLHVDKLGQYRGKGRKKRPRRSTESDILRGELRVFVDHLLMQRCRTLIASRSAFSLSAAGVSKVNENVYFVNVLKSNTGVHESQPACRKIDPYLYW